MTTRSSLVASPALPRGLSHELAGQDLSRRLYVAPLATLGGPPAASAIAGGQGWSLAGGSLAFTACSLLWREDRQVIEAVAPFPELLDWSEAEGEAVAHHVGARLAAAARKRAPFAGLAMDRPHIMGIVNVTPDSFSDGGAHFDLGAAIAHGLRLRDAGADILDVGGESTRPGAAEIGPDEEMRRVLPVVKALAEAGAVVSVDTRHAAVMGAAVDHGAAIINDITALTGDPEALAVAASSGAAVVLMHMQGDPHSMQHDPQYDFAPLDIYDYLAERLAACRQAGIPTERLCVDPGIGFGKTVEHNVQTLARLGLYHALGVPLLLGVSRKSFIGKLSAGEPPIERLAGSLAAGLAGLDAGAQILRVHDVAQTAQALAVWKAMRGA